MPGRFPLNPVALGSDPFCQDGFCGDPTLPPFDPTLYNFARFIGTQIGRYFEAGPITQTGGDIRVQTEANSSWHRMGNSSADGCFLTVRPRDTNGMAPSNPGSFFSAAGNWKWVCNFDNWVLSEGSSFIDFTMCETLIFRDGGYAGVINGVDAGGSSRLTGELMATCRGKWQLLYLETDLTSLPASTPAQAEWYGNVIPDGGGFNAAATFRIPVTVPPYTYIN